MYERTVQSAVRYLASIPLHGMPMKELWSSVAREAEAAAIEKCSLADFAALLEADPRFAISENGYDPGDAVYDDAPSEDRDLLLLGFCPTCFVRLRGASEVKESEEPEEMPSIRHRHLSETRHSTTRPRKTSPKPPGNPSRPKKSPSAAKRPLHKGGKRRTH